MIGKLVKDGGVNLVGLLLGLVAVAVFDTALAGLIVELVATVLARVLVEWLLKTDQEELHFEVSCDVVGFAIANLAILLGSIISFTFPFMGAVVAMSTTAKLVKLLP
jgi:hypothetical protein